MSSGLVVTSGVCDVVASGEEVTSGDAVVESGDELVGFSTVVEGVLDVSSGFPVKILISQAVKHSATASIAASKANFRIFNPHFFKSCNLIKTQRNIFAHNY